MKNRNIFGAFVHFGFLPACVLGILFLLMSNQVEAQVTYTITGVYDGLGGDSPLVGDGEPFIAVFEIDDSVEDSDPSDENRGLYSGAVVSSSFSFAGGFNTMVDFAGGDVVVLPESGGGGIILTPPGGSGVGAFIVYSSATLPSDALLISAQEISGDDAQSFWYLNEPDGSSLYSFSGVDLGAPMVLSVTAAPTVIYGDMDMSGDVSFADIPPFIEALRIGGYQVQGDFDENGVVDFSDIPPFVQALVGA